jgi:hypothetical protein
MYHALKGTLTDAEVEEAQRPIEGVEDADVDAGAHDLESMRAMVNGEWRRAHDELVGLATWSLLNAPYVLPIAGWMAVLAGEPTLARAALDRLRELGTRGRAIEAQRTAVEAGIAPGRQGRGAPRVPPGDLAGP